MSSEDAKSGNRRGLDAGLRIRMRAEEERIASQHGRLDEWCRDLYGQIDKDGAEASMSDFLLFETALDAHMTVEEEIYFPALHGLCPDAADELTDLIAAHEQIREAMGVVKRGLEGGMTTRARLAFEQVSRDIAEHERQEEDLIVRLNAGPLLDHGHSSF